MDMQQIDETKENGIRDVLGRSMRDLRISVTDRCNFRCTYCMPKEIFGPQFAFLPQTEILQFEEIVRLARLFVKNGVRKIRLTGGEPLLRKNLERLISMLSKIEGIEDIALTTNGSLLTLEKALALRQAGLHRISISLDALEDRIFMKLNDVHFPVERVLAGINHAQQAGLSPVKVNMVLKRGVNHKAVVEMAQHFRGTPHIVRFIEYMDVGNSNGWRLNEVFDAQSIIDQIQKKWPVEAISPSHQGEVAKRYRYLDGQGEIGIISSVTQPFCRTCTRARLSSDGKLYTCLFAQDGFDFRNLLRNGHSDDEIEQILHQIWRTRQDRYSELRTQATSPRYSKVEMSKIGG